jgi:murein L,D-transpeptidase YcbB/YkuD
MKTGFMKSFSANLSVRLIVFFLLITTNVTADQLRLPSVRTTAHTFQDSLQQSTILRELDSYRLYLHYPRSVARFYKNNGFQFAFIYPQSGEKLAWSAMILLGCSPQYGLDPADYHPLELLQAKLNGLIAPNNLAQMAEKARFDILLVDAMITLINNLHFGKLNPAYPHGKLDAGAATLFFTKKVLADAINLPDFIAAIENMQPNSKAYTSLQGHLRWLSGRNALTNNTKVNHDMRRMAVNMERLRWANSTATEKYAIEVNIPAHSLSFRTPDSTYSFNVFAGAPTAATPVLQGHISYFTIVTKTGKQKLFIFPITGVIKYSLMSASLIAEAPNKSSQIPATVRVVDAQKLVELLLGAGGSRTDGLHWRDVLKVPGKMIIHLQKQIPVQISYLTCRVQEGELIIYPDVYQLDQQLERWLFNSPSVVSAKGTKTTAND